MGNEGGVAAAEEVSDMLGNLPVYLRPPPSTYVVLWVGSLA
jgi:hypothetical protein